MADIQRVVTRKAFHYNDPSLDYYQLLDLLKAETGNLLNVYDGQLNGQELTIVEYNYDNGERENIVHRIPLGFWLVQMVDCSWEVMETPVIKDLPIWE